MVFRYLQQLLADRFGCDADEMELSSSFVDLNLSNDDLDEISFCLGEVYGVEIDTESLYNFETVEDLVGYVEDRM